jgi:hypothetical protein
VIDATKDRIDAPSIHAVLLRSMMQAYYGANNAGHFGLAYEAYTHFTSQFVATQTCCYTVPLKPFKTKTCTTFRGRFR